MGRALEWVFLIGLLHILSAFIHFMTVLDILLGLIIVVQEIS